MGVVNSPRVVVPQGIRGEKPQMSDKSIGDIWQRLNVWQKVLVALFAAIWVVASVGIALVTADNLILTVGSIFVLWLGYVGLAFVITRDYGN
jgi:hypothetical protein